MKECIVCEEEKKEGMYICSSFVCKECEQEMVNTEPEESRYKEFVKKLRKIRKPSVFS